MACPSHTIVIHFNTLTLRLPWSPTSSRARVSSSWLVLLTPDLQASLFWGSMPSSLHTSTSALTHSLQDFLGLPRPLGPRMAIPVIEYPMAYLLLLVLSLNGGWAEAKNDFFQNMVIKGNEMCNNKHADIMPYSDP